MIKKIFKIITILGFLLVLIIFEINSFVISSTQDQIITKEEYCNLENIDCILILGAGIRGEEPTPMLKDRLDQGLELYLEKESILVMSGDHGTDYHNEVGVMKNYAKKQPVEVFLRMFFSAMKYRNTGTGPFDSLIADHCQISP